MSNPRSSRFVTLIDEPVLRGEVAGVVFLYPSALEGSSELVPDLVDMVGVDASGRVW